MPAQSNLIDYPLHRAVRDHDVSRVQRLLAAGADPREKDVRGFRPLDALARELSHPHDLPIADALIAAMGSSWWHTARDALRFAVEYDNLDLVRLLMRAGFRLGYRATLLHRAVQLDRVAVLPLVTSGMNIDRLDPDGHAPLHYAISEAAVNALVAEGAKVDRRTRDNQTPLHRAPNAEVADALLARGAAVDARDLCGRTPLHLAADSGVSRALLHSGAVVDARDETGATPLILDVLRGGGSAGALLRAGANPNAHDHGGSTPLLKAAQRGRRKEIGYLLAAGADPRLRDQGGDGLAEHLRQVWPTGAREEIYLRVLRASPDYVLGLDDPSSWDDAFVAVMERIGPGDRVEFTHEQLARLLASPSPELRRAVLGMIGRLDIA